MTTKPIVIAPNLQIASHWARRVFQHGTDYSYVCDPYQLRGLSDSIVIFVIDDTEIYNFDLLEYLHVLNNTTDILIHYINSENSRQREARYNASH